MWWIALAILFALSCGGENDGGLPGPGLPTETPPPSATPTPVTTEIPTPTPDPPDPDEVLLIVVRASERPPGRPTGPLVYRFAAGAWKEIQLPNDFSPRIARFANRSTAYIAGWGKNETSTLLRSTDAGKTWADATRELPPEIRNRLVENFSFRGTDRVWWVNGGFFGGVFVFSATDLRADDWRTGRWLPVEGWFGPVRTSQEFLLRGDSVGLVFGPYYTRLPPADEFPVLIDPDSQFHRYDAVTVGDRAWLAGGAATFAGFRPAVCSSRPGEPWELDEVKGATEASLFTIDVRPNGTGVACGSASSGTELIPACFSMASGTRTWHRAELPPGLPATLVNHVILGSAGRGFASMVALPMDSRDPPILETTDSGRTWHAVSTPDVGNSFLQSVARNTDLTE